MKFVSANEIVLKLLPNKKWSPTAGFIILKTFTVGSKSYPASGNEGTCHLPSATIFQFCSESYNCSACRAVTIMTHIVLDQSQSVSFFLSFRYLLHALRCQSCDDLQRS
jgi:hypothetical protein